MPIKKRHGRIANIGGALIGADVPAADGIYLGEFTKGILYLEGALAQVTF